MRFDSKTRYLQLAFNGSLASAERIIPMLPSHDRILVEAGTPFIKRYGQSGIRRMADLWDGRVVADLKTCDGAAEEVALAGNAGAAAATVLGSVPTETLDFFVAKCKSSAMWSMIDMLGVDEPWRVLMCMRQPPDVVVLHKGRDEESTRGKVIQYKNVNKIRSKFDVLISAAGGVDLKEARSAIFNGANIVVVNIVEPGDPWTGISTASNVSKIAEQFLATIE
ncbi:MAG: orotidine 5'-phosphate decarboxylase / HUMPS family protein [Candidatus Micrarchaeota archaeon]